MNIRNKILLLFCASGSILMTVLYFVRSAQERQNDIIFQSAVEQQTILINSAISVQSMQLDQIVLDYSNWDDILPNLKIVNNIWAVDNIGSIVKSFNLYSVNIYNQEHHLIYNFGKSINDHFSDPSTGERILKSILKNKIAHYFEFTPEGLFEISGSSIHPTLDSAHLTPPAGYFFICRIWNKGFLRKLSENTVSRVYFETTQHKYDQLISSDSIVVSKDLFNFADQKIGELIVKKPNNALLNYHYNNDFVFYLISVLLLVFLLIFFFILYWWIRRPLKIISDCLQEDDTSQLEILKKGKNEFSQIAGLISVFYRQKHELERENTEINKIQHELIKQRSILHGMALASNHLLTIEDFDTAISDALEAISLASGIDRIFIYKNISQTTSRDKKIKRIYEYVNPSIKKRVDTEESAEISFIYKSNSWFKPLLQGKTIKGYTREFEPDIKQLFENQLINSIMILPIIDQKNHLFWGFVGFADCTDDHLWTTAEETVLSMLAHNIAGALRRKKSQEELREAMVLAKSADHAKSEFLASMSHEIRTPMNGVIGMTSLLLLSELTPVQREYVNIIENSGEGLMNIINEILDFSKIESGRMELEETSFDLRLCIEDVLDLMAPKSLEKRIDIIYFIDPKIHQHIYGDGFRLRQIIVNLVSNAIKFTEKGDILITISLASQDELNVVLEFSVKDTGIGIPAEKIDSLFSPFTQVDASTTRKYGGTGLGLAITSSLVKLMMGKIWVNSEYGKGSDFRFTIKTRYSTPNEDINPLYKTLQNLTGKSVLIVDDNATNRKVLTWQCEYWGLKTLAVENGIEALSIIDQQKFDIAILDMQMPDMDGVMLASKIRVKFTKEQLPLIMLTSIGFSRESDELAKLFSFFVNKPIKHSQLAEILLKVIAPLKKTEMVSTTPNEDFAKVSTKFPFRILVAEDNLINQKLIRNIFELLGYKIDIAANGIEVLEALKRKIYDIIFMDIQMPEMNGYETTRIIISHRNLNRPIIIAMTANAMQGDREKCFEVGMDDYVTKPMRVDSLIKVLQNWGEKKFPNNLYI